MVKVFERPSLNRCVAVILGTRPGIVKMSPVIRELKHRGMPFTIIHSGQHYSPELDAVFFRDLELDQPDVQLPSMKEWTLHGEQTAEMLKGIERALIDLRPMAVLVGGDANTNLSGALAARKLGIQICHDEAGLRSYDWLMPEEHNRVIMDHISEFLFAPNDRARATLESERVRGRIDVTGTTIVDAVEQNGSLAESRSQVLERLGLHPAAYVLLTLHHEETVDYPDTLRAVLAGVAETARVLDLPIVFPAHPRTRRRLEDFELLRDVAPERGIRLVEPLGYLDFLRLQAHACLTMTDSGGVIQEAAILGVPCLTLGRATEWEDTVLAGANVVCGTQAEAIVKAAQSAISGRDDWTNPFGPPGAASRIVDVLESEVLAGSGFLPPRPLQSKGPSPLDSSRDTSDEPDGAPSGCRAEAESRR